MSIRSTVAGLPPDLGAKVAFLSCPQSYPEPTSQVEAIETHMAWVFLTDAHAYKLKKPVRYDYLDFSTLEARRRCCEDEVRLNRRLAPDVYLGVVSLGTGSGGALEIGGGAVVHDWLVRMRRLPAELMLDRMIAGGTVTVPALEALGRRLARFYGEAPREALAADAYLGRLARELDESRTELVRYGLDADLVDRALAGPSGFLASRPAGLRQRVGAGRIVEGHGDLRPEHICLGDPPLVIDCIEFNRAFRILDPLDDLSYLALECRRHGAVWVGRAVIDAYAAAADDPPPEELIRFYLAYRAAVRAKIAIWHLRDDGASRAEHWVARARSYLQIGLAVLPVAAP